MLRTAESAQPDGVMADVEVRNPTRGTEYGVRSTRLMSQNSSVPCSSRRTCLEQTCRKLRLGDPAGYSVCNFVIFGHGYQTASDFFTLGSISLWPGACKLATMHATRICAWSAPYPDMNPDAWPLIAPTDRYLTGDITRIRAPMEKLSRYRFHSISGPRYAERRGQGVKAGAGCLFFFFVFLLGMKMAKLWNTNSPGTHDRPAQETMIDSCQARTCT